MDGPAAFVRHLTENSYHPRSDAHSNAICLAILADLVAHCSPFAKKAARGELVAKLNHTVSNPAPQVGDPTHYATMIRRACTAYRDRWVSN